MQQNKDPINLEMHEENGITLPIFSQNMQLPKKIFRIQAVHPHLELKVVPDQLSHGDIVEVELIPTDEFEAKIEFDIQTKDNELLG